MTCNVLSVTLNTTIPFLLASSICLLVIFLPILPEESHTVSRLDVIGGDLTWLWIFVCVLSLCYMYFLVKDACLFLSYLIWFCLAV